jgi:quinol monooxygenase YgiN
MTNCSGKQNIFSSYNEMKICFRVMPPPLDDTLKAVMKTLSESPGCLSYALSEQRYRMFHWTICGIWISDEAKKRHYSSDPLQELLQLLINSDVSAISFSEADKECMTSADLMQGRYRPLTGRIRDL